jgi:hypothetical protein
MNTNSSTKHRLLETTFYLVSFLKQLFEDDFTTKLIRNSFQNTVMQINSSHPHTQPLFLGSLKWQASIPGLDVGRFSHHISQIGYEAHPTFCQEDAGDFFALGKSAEVRS